MRPSRGVLLLGLAWAASCRPDLGERESLVTETRILAVRGDPPEAKPGETVRYSLLVASPVGAVPFPAASWAFCLSAKLLTENGAVSAVCLSDAVLPLAERAATVEAVTPSDACALFGPDVASADLRPRDPDVTGGYFQPVRVTLLEQQEAKVAFGMQRITCNLGNAAADVARDFGVRYVANRNPELAALTASRDGRPLALDEIARGTTVTLRAPWTEGSAEGYVAYDPATRALVSRRESLRVSWFATGGTFRNDRTGRGEEELDAFSENQWTAPAEAGVTALFVVLRDSRGGMSFSTYALVTN